VRRSLSDGNASAQAMVSSYQQLDWLGQPAGRGSDFRKRSVIYIKFKLLKGRETETRVRECDSRCAVAHAHSLKGTLVVNIMREQNLKQNQNEIILTNSLGFTQPLTEMSTRNIQVIMFLGSKVRRVRRADNLTTICEPIVYKMWDP
jgi:hypothetical protein